VFLTYIFNLRALTIARFYNSRWQVRLFFKWAKQYLCAKAFRGANDNAMKIKRWVAIGICLLAAIVRKELGMKRGLIEVLQILRLVLFEKTPVFRPLSERKTRYLNGDWPNQLIGFNLQRDGYGPV
jgi:IS4 transposase